MKASAKHTPGPWKAAFGQDALVLRRPGTSFETRIVCGDALYHPENVADAHLVAAAPELLAAAKLALKEAESWIHDQLDGTSSVAGALADLEPVRRAIAKAEGLE